MSLYAPLAGHRSNADEGGSLASELRQKRMSTNDCRPDNDSGPRLLDRITDKQPTDKAAREERARCDIMQMPLTAREWTDE